MTRTLAIALALTAPAAFAQLPSAAPRSPVPEPTPPPIALPRHAGGAFSGSVPLGEPMPGMMDLSLREALDRGLRYNLGVVEGGENVRFSRAQRLFALSRILPSLDVRPMISEQQINLLAYGFPLPPGTPPIVGPFKVVDLRAYLSDNLSLSGWRSWRAGGEAERASQLSLRDTRDQVVEIVVDLYLATLSASARVTASRARVNTAEALYRQAVDRKNAGTAPAIDVLRAQVEMQGQQQRLFAYEGDVEKRKLSLARAIGLPLGQRFRLTEDVPYTPLPPEFSLEASLAAAYRSRSDYRAAQSLERAAQLTLSAARAQRWPSATLTADYGAIGPRIEQTHGTFSVAAAANIPVFDAGRIRSGIEQAQARLAQRKAEREDLRGRIDSDIRVAMVNLDTARRQVEVARSNVDLAGQQLRQAQDRFAAGVTNNLEVVQAQEAAAAADETLISSLYAFNSAKVALMRARGESDQALMRLLTGK